MTISDRTRKLLWGRSGNRCAICRHVLMIDPTPLDPSAVVGQECHIVGTSPVGPRAGTLNLEAIDGDENLILLCATDHRRVDSQPQYFTPDRLRAIKLAHETWVHAALTSTPPPNLQATIRRQSRVTLQWVLSGSTLFGIIMGAEAYDFDHDDLNDESEIGLVASFLQTLQDYGEAAEDLESGERVRARFVLGQEIDALSEAGFAVYGGRVHGQLVAGQLPAGPWVTATIRIKRLADVMLEAVRHVEAEESKDASERQAAT